MKFNIKDIEGSGKKFTGEISKELIGEREEDKLSFVSPIVVSGHIGKAEDIVYVNCHVSGRISALCAYTLVRIEEDYSQDLSFDIEIDKNTHEVDIEEDVRQEIVLGLPMRLISEGGREKAMAELAKKRAYFNLSEDDQIDGTEEKSENLYRPFENLNLDGLDG